MTSSEVVKEKIVPPPTSELIEDATSIYQNMVKSNSHQDHTTPNVTYSTNQYQSGGASDAAIELRNQDIKISPQFGHSPMEEDMSANKDNKNTLTR